jgi:hypothetical protein
VLWLRTAAAAAAVLVLLLLLAAAAAAPFDCVFPAVCCFARFCLLAAAALLLQLPVGVTLRALMVPSEAPLTAAASAAPVTLQLLLPISGRVVDVVALVASAHVPGVVRLSSLTMVTGMPAIALPDKLPLLLLVLGSGPENARVSPCPCPCCC